MINIHRRKNAWEQTSNYNKLFFLYITNYLNIFLENTGDVVTCTIKIDNY